MEYLKSVFLGIIQGATEFLPVSSSGHIEISKKLIDFPAGDLYTILLHIATLSAVVIFFRKNIAVLSGSLWRYATRKTVPDDRENLIFLLTILIATVLTVITALVLEPVNDYVKTRTQYISVFFMVTGIILVIAHFFKERSGQGKTFILRGLIVGIAQGIGILPGISRSGITIAASLATGISREKAGEFSFLLSIPAIIGALVYDVKDAHILFEDVALPVVASGMAAAFITGFLSLFILIKMIKKGNLFLFSLYLIPLGIITLVFPP